MKLQHPPRTMNDEDLAEVRANFLARLNDGPLDQLPMGCRSVERPSRNLGAAMHIAHMEHPRLWKMWAEFRRFKWARALASEVSTVARVRPMSFDDGSIGFEISSTPGEVAEALAPRVVAEAETVLRELPK